MEENDRLAAEESTKGVIVEEVKPEGDKPKVFADKREALRQAIADHKGETEAKEAPTKIEVKAAVQADPEPPSEFSTAGKKAWKEKDISGIQKEYNRINTLRVQEVTRAQASEKKAVEESKSWQDIDVIAKPYIDEAMSRGMTRAQAVSNAFALIGALKKADPEVTKAELKRAGIDLDKSPSTPTLALPPELEKKIEGMQAFQKSLQDKEEARELSLKVQSFDEAFTKLKTLKNRTGEPVLPDLELDHNTKEGELFFRRLGSRAQDPEFQALVLSRFPEADFTVIVSEAYKSVLGRVSGNPAQVSKSNPQQLNKSRRAAASTPGRNVSRTENSNLVGKLGKREALRQAIRDHRERYN